MTEDQIKVELKKRGFSIAQDDPDNITFYLGDPMNAEGFMLTRESSDDDWKIDILAMEEPSPNTVKNAVQITQQFTVKLTDNMRQLAHSMGILS